MSNVGDFLPMYMSTTDGPSSRTDGLTSRNNSGGDQTSVADDTTSSSEHPTPNDSQSQHAIASPPVAMG